MIFGRHELYLYFETRAYSLHYEKFADGTVKEIEVPYELPDGWEWARLRDISTRIQYGYTASASDKGNAHLLRITDIQNNQVKWKSVPFCNIDNRKLTTMQLMPMDIVIARTGGTLGKSFLIRKIPETSVFASYLIRIQSVISSQSEFNSYFFESPNYWKQLQKLSSGTGQPNVNATNLSSLFIPVPPLSEQIKIISQMK